uniref:Uncharacterized protein n=1 Tax=Rhizophora mucronata TaxID=61149 RepID=A0A2P2Q3Q5_RHIMU
MFAACCLHICFPFITVAYPSVLLLLPCDYCALQPRASNYQS